MRFKAVSGITLALLYMSMLWLAFNIQPIEAHPRTWTVDDDGPADFHTIQEAISWALSGDTILVAAGTYYGDIIMVRSVRFVGENRSTTIINGNENGEIAVGTRNVTISGFTIKNYTQFILLSYNCTIIDNIITNNLDGLVLSYGGNHTINKNVITSNSGDGIYIRDSNDNTISDNTITSNSRCGIWLGPSMNNTIIGNKISNNDYGIMVDHSKGTLEGNVVSDNYIGVQLHFAVGGNLLRDNNMTGNTYNLGVYGKDLSDFIQDIDSSNRVNGKTVYYIMHRSNLIIDLSTHPDVGYLGIVNSTNTIVKDLNLTLNEQGVLLAYTKSSTIKNVNVPSNLYGIYLAHSSKNTVEHNTITKNAHGLYLLESNDGNVIRNNTITSNDITGLQLISSRNNTLGDNNMTGNGNNFGVYGASLSHFFQDIDTSNTVDGKSIYYWVNQHNKQIPADAGYVAAVNSTNIIVKDLTLIKNCQGVLFSYASNCTIHNVVALDNSCGFCLQSSNYNTISGSTVSSKISLSESCIALSDCVGNNIINNTLSNSYTGLKVHYSNNMVAHNTISENYVGIDLSSSKNNTISCNVVSDNHIGIDLTFCENNTIVYNTIPNNDLPITAYVARSNGIHHNNFVNNIGHVSLYASPTAWDDGYPSGGNYWSDHNPPDLYSGPFQNETGSDGIGDEPYIMEENNTDKYPLIYPYGYVPSPDINDDQVVDIFDVVTVAEAFGSIPGDSNWNPITDLVQDEVIDIFDVVLLAKNFGKTA